MKNQTVKKRKRVMRMMKVKAAMTTIMIMTMKMMKIMMKVAVKKLYRQLNK